MPKCVNEKKKRKGKRKKLIITKEIWMQKDNLIEGPLPHKTYTSHINQRPFGFMNKIPIQRMIDYFKQSLHLGPNMSTKPLCYFAIFSLMMGVALFWEHLLDNNIKTTYRYKFPLHV